MRLNGLYRYFIFLLVISACGNEETKKVEPFHQGLMEQQTTTPVQLDTITPDTTSVVSFVDTSIVLTANEMAGIDNVLEVYGGVCTKKRGVASEGKVAGNYFELEIKDSKSLQSYKEAPEIPSATIAWFFYSALDNEKEQLDFIRSSIHYDGHDKSTNDYSIADLKIVEQKLKMVDQLTELIRNQNYEKIRTMLSDKIYDFPINDIVSNMDTVYKVCGAPTGIELYTFQFYELADNKEGVSDANENERILHISYSLLREKQSHECSVEFAANMEDDEILVLKYKY